MESVESSWNQPTFDWMHDCGMRMAQCTPQDTARGMFLKGMLESIRTLAGEDVAKRCLETSGHERLVDFFSYPATLQLQFLLVAMPALIARCGSYEQALRQLGRNSVMDFLGTTAGKMLMSLARKDPKRLVDSLPSAHKVSVNFGTQVVEWMGPKHGRVILKRELMPHAYHAGVVEMLLELGGASLVGVRSWQSGRLDSEIAFTWE
ncbi:TIGR02265 family protein [Archangium lansingense]|uniref:TIGR02265 family protein n=1 Tax=Archangium lansingense TaxID=2995310 RepID=A0ABT4AH52_9BACT|nr:TIGR02265 family protein [Archangium lansinium]MCY1080524.1 TIGR02265 family protein [Archangium lansinium]